MADIFISYAREDHGFVARLAAALEAVGCSLWWDRDLVGGAEFSADIERELKAAKAVIVVWSVSGVKSHWVKDEAAIARDKGTLVPLSLDSTEAPIGFRQFHAIDFAAWKGEADAAPFASLKGSIAQKTGAAPAAAAPAPKPKVWALASPKLLLAGAAVLVLALGYFIADKFWLSKPVAAGSPATETLPGTPGGTAPAPAISDKSVAVLPFVDMSEKKDSEYFSDGLSEALIDLIAKIPELRVPARTSSFYFKGKQTTIADIAKALGVAHVLEGSVRKSGDTLRITAQLIRADSGYHLWSETYDRKLDDIFKVQDDIAGAVVKALKVSLLGAAAPHAAPAANTQAYTLYLQGRAFAQRLTRADNEKASAYLQQSVKLDPNFAPAWAWLGTTRVRAFGLFGSQTNFEKYERGVKDAAARALALDPYSSAAHATIATAYWSMDRDFEAAEREFRKAIELDPGDANTKIGAGLFFLGRGRLDEALKLGQEAVALDPLAVEAYRLLGTALHFSGKLAEAEAVFRKGLELNPAAEGLHFRLGLVLLARDQRDAALAEMKLEPNPERRQIGLALAYDALGRRALSDRALGDPEKLATGGWYYQLAEVYAHRKDKDRAFAWLERAYQNHDPGIENYLEMDPLLEALRPDPRYEALLRKMKLPL